MLLPRKVLLLILVVLLQACAKDKSPQEYLKDAQSYQAKGEIKAAIISLKKALQVNPDFFDARFQLGSIYLDTGNGALAEKEFSRAKKTAKPASLLYIPLLRAYFIQDKNQEIVDQKLELSELSPQQQIQWFRLRAESYLQLGQPNQAEAELAQAVKLKLNSKELALSGVKLQFARHQDSQARINLDSLLKTNPDFAEAWYVSAKQFRAEKNFPATELALQKAVDLSEAPILSRLGLLSNIELIEVQIAQQRFDQAKLNIERIQSKSRAKQPLLQYFSAVLLYHDQQYQQAKELLQNVLNEMPEFTPAYLVYGATLFELQQYETANVNIEKFLSVLPNNVHARRLLAAIHLKQNQPIDALEVLAPVADKIENDERYMSMLAKASMSSGDAKTASSYLRKLVQKNPASIQLRAELAESLIGMGEFEEAIKEIEKSGANEQQKALTTVVIRLRQKKYNIARNMIQAQIANKASPQWYTLAGVVELVQHNNDRAKDYFNKAIAIDAGYGSALVYLSQLAIKEQDFEGAKQYLTQALEKNPKHWMSLFSMAHVSAALKASEEDVMAWVERAHQADPRALPPVSVLVKQAVRLGKKEKALRLAEDLVQATKNSPGAVRLLSKVHLTLGTPNAAIKVLQDLARQFPAMSGVYSDIAAIYIKQKDWLAAKKALQKVLAIDDKNLLARLKLIRVNLQLKDFTSARAQALVVQQGKYHPAISLQISADIEAASGHWKLAANGYKKALALNENALLVQKLARAYQQSNNMPQALKLLQTWHDKQSTVGVSLQLAEYYGVAGKPKNALQVLQELSKRQPKNPLVWNNLSWAYFENKDDNYLLAAQKAFELEPKSFVVADTYGWMLLQSDAENNKAKALSILKSANEKSPNIATIKYHLAVALQQNNRNAEAKVMLEQALNSPSVFPEKAEAIKLLESL